MCGADLDGALGHLAVFAHHAHGVALLGARDSLLRQGDGIAGLGLLNAHAQVQAGQQLALGVGHLGAQRDLARGGVHRQVGEQQLSCLGVLRTIAHHEFDTGGLCAACTLELSTFHGPSQLKDVARRLGEVHVHGVDLLHHRQGRCFALSHERTFGNQSPADAARDGRGHTGITQVDVCRTYGSPGGGHICLCLLFGSFGIHKILFADGVGTHQRAVAFHLSTGLCEVGLGLGQACARAFRCGGVGSGVNAEQRLPCLHITAFLEKALLQDACGASTYLCNPRGLHTARQFGDQADIARRCRHHTHLNRWHLRPSSGCLAIRLATRGEKQCCCCQGNQRDSPAGGKGAKGGSCRCITQHGSPF